MTSRQQDPTGFAGWRIVAVAAVAFGMTGPGQTAGVSVFVDPMMASLHLTRSQVSTAYLLGTLAAAVAMPRVGRLIDERGARQAMAGVGLVFGIVLAAMAGVQGLVTLALGFVGIRMLGQGSLTLVATTAVAPWFDRRRGLAMGVTTAVGSALLSLVPLASAAVIGHAGWRAAWLVTAGVVWAVVLPLALRGLIDRPADVGQVPDGPAGPPRRRDGGRRRARRHGRVAGAEHPAGAGAPRPPAVVSVTRREALRTPMFWAVTGGVAATGMIGTALAFHQIDLLGDRGLTPVEAAANYLPQTAAALGATLLVGLLIDRIAARWVLALSMLLLMSAMVTVSLVSPGWSAVGYGMLLGAAGASARALEAASFPALFGLRHLGAIRGVVTAISVASTALGPVVLSVGRDLTGRYLDVLVVLLVVPVGVMLLALVARTPQPASPEEATGGGSVRRP